jgi:hypothetical protein
MNDGLVAAIIIGVIAYGFISIVRVITDYLLRRRLIQLGHVDGPSVSILNKPRNSHLDSLKWGLIILFGGVGFIIISIPAIDLDSPLPFGIIAVCVATGFLVYFFLAKNMLEKAPPEEVLHRQQELQTP